MAGIFITSTGTGIGKTYVMAQLLAYDRTQKSLLTASKPIISGWPQDEKEIQYTDTGMLLSAQQKEISASQLDEISPWRFKAPLSPDMAAKREGKSIDLAALMHYSQQKIDHAKKNQKIHLIEGVGGVMVPLNGAFTVLDWIEQLKIACILVVGSYLGTISHTLTAVRALQVKKIPIIAIVVNETVGSSVPFQETSENLATLLAPYPVFSLGYHENSELNCLQNDILASLYAQISTKMGQFLVTI